MRYFACAFVLLALPVSAAAQHSWSLPSIGLPPPAARPANAPWTQNIPWAQPQLPSWEKHQLPAWEKARVAQPRRGDGHSRRRNTQYVYVPYAVPAQQEPQVIVIQQPPVTRIVEVEVPARQPELRVEIAPQPASPPYVPAGDRTVYVIPGCYVGNVSPINLKLPANCDITKLTTYVP
jgi:hypothetical protein